MHIWTRWIFRKNFNFQNTKIIALDRDIDCQKKANEISDKYQSRLIFKNKRFSQLENLKLKNENIKGVIFDLGFSYVQIKDSKKGLSFNSSGDLDMRMGLNDFSAEDVINKLETKELEKIFKFFGDEKDAKKISIKITKKKEK